MKIFSFKVIYILSLIILGLLLISVFFQPFAASKEYSTVQKEQLLKTDDGWIIQFDLVNREDNDVGYLIRCLAGENASYQEPVLVPAGGIYTYSRHIRADKVAAERLKMTILRGGEKLPFEETTYYLK